MRPTKAEVRELVHLYVWDVLPIETYMYQLTVHIIDHNLKSLAEINFLAKTIAEYAYGTNKSTLLARSAMELLLAGGLSEEEISNEIMKHV
jgi:hypothetical protein